ncbi:MAG: AAA family ATPase [Candidatus Levybacteria bacterium]|nr:AAA family ATPase [Candidatus Levybacteria bacterium]
MESGKKTILAFVGMPGSGKSEAVFYLGKKDIPCVRFGKITEDEAKIQGLPLTPENEQIIREELRKEMGMGAYAVKAKPKIDEMLKKYDRIAIDGLYSWEEYTYLKKEFKGLIIIHIYSEPKIRYERLFKRKVRPFSFEQSYLRDVMEIERLNKDGPIAIADYLIENNTDSILDLRAKVDSLLKRLGIKITND